MRPIHPRATGPMICVALLAVYVWLVVSSLVFALRHPWATETQRLLHTFDALMFRRVECPYDVKVEVE